MASKAAAQDVDVLILTGDRDMFQLINERVRVLYTKGGPSPETVAYGLPELLERYNLAPEQFVDLKALIGDNSDNIPGVTGVGEKTAIKFLNDFGTVDKLYENLEQISGPKTRKNLEDARDDVERNRRLMSITTDLDINFDPATSSVGEYDQQAVLRFFNAMEFRSLIRELPQQASEADETQSSTPQGNDAGQMALFADGESRGNNLANLVATTPTGIEYKTIQSEADLEELVDGPGQCKDNQF